MVGALPVKAMEFVYSCNQWFQTANILMFLEFISNQYCNKLCDPSK